MYSVMLVDDEKLILEGLENIIDWGKLGLKITSTSLNGYDALEKFKEEPVDIVITDINMPRMTGLELIKEIRSFNSTTRFIILTGYDEFRYAQEAIKYGIESYILKPIDEEALELDLTNIIKQFNQIKKEKNKILSINSDLIDYIGGNIGEDYIYYIKDSLSIDIEDSKYTVANISVLGQDVDEENLGVDEMYEIVRKNSASKYEVIHKYSNQVILINSWDLATSREEIINYYECMKEAFIEAFGPGNKEVFITIGDTVEHIEELRDSYETVRRLKKYILTEGSNKCISSENLKNHNEKIRDFKEEIANINRLIIEKDIKELEEYIYKILDDEDLTPKNIYDFSIKVIILVNDISNDLQFTRKYGRDSLSNTIIELSNESSRESIKLFIMREVEELIDNMCEQTIKYSPVVQQVINIIDEKYYEDLSLKTLAHKYNINSSYLGQIFSKETGTSFSEYLNKTRNMKAKELILNTNMRINDISSKVGYTGTSYFYRKFKKYYGVSPSTLREMKNY